MKTNFTFLLKNTKIKRQLLLLFVSVLLTSASIYAQNFVEQYGRLQVNGSHVTAENGDKISLAGMSLFWSNAY